MAEYKIEESSQAFPFFLQDETLFYYHYESPFGIWTITAGPNALTGLSFGAHEFAGKTFGQNQMIDAACNALIKYFQGIPLAPIPLAPTGTNFQKAVWQALCTIPYGETASYQAIAQKIGREKAYRAVGNANHQNPIMLFIPCHRVIKNDGSLGGFGGGPALKKALLDLERKGVC